jgi:hypothetical protein
MVYLVVCPAASTTYVLCTQVQALDLEVLARLTALKGYT